MNAEGELDHILSARRLWQRMRIGWRILGCSRGDRAFTLGQGTENVYFFFDNAYLELLELHDETAARSPVAAPLRLWERIHWQQTGACPFGICLRLASGSLEAVSAETWGYAAPFLPPDVTLPIFTPPNTVDLPLVFLSPAAVLPA